MKGGRGSYVSEMKEAHQNGRWAIQAARQALFLVGMEHHLPVAARAV
jgi:hypothetical protein